jgi:signal transduction histidine kinase
LHKRGAGAIGLVISGAILLIYVFINRGDIPDITGIWLLVGAALSVAGLIFWWRRGLTNLYREKVRERNAQEYEQIIAEKDEQIRAFREDNKMMSDLIHKDNKLLPALRETVVLLMSSGADTLTNGKHILEQIQRHVDERTEVLSRSGSNMPSTNDIMIDGIIYLMMKRASGKGIKFDIAVMGDISELTAEIIPADELQTLLADLIENAIIATSRCEHKQILITTIESESAYELSVQDSGIPFEAETLLSLGLKKASTHLNEGGSGAGYMTAFKILHRCKASLIITEYQPEQNGFTKSVAVRFDGKDAYIIQTYRADALKEMRARADVPDDYLTIISC